MRIDYFQFLLGILSRQTMDSIICPEIKLRISQTFLPVGFFKSSLLTSGHVWEYSVSNPIKVNFRILTSIRKLIWLNGFGIFTKDSLQSDQKNITISRNECIRDQSLINSHHTREFNPYHTSWFSRTRGTVSVGCTRDMVNPLCQDCFSWRKTFGNTQKWALPFVISGGEKFENSTSGLSWHYQKLRN